MNDSADLSESLARLTRQMDNVVKTQSRNITTLEVGL